MRPTTAQAIRRAGVALQAAITEVRTDPDAPARLKLQLRQLRLLAEVMGDVPHHPLEQGEAEGDHPRVQLWTTCDSCQLRRPLTALSPLACPRCGQLPGRSEVVEPVRPDPGNVARIRGEGRA